MFEGKLVIRPEGSRGADVLADVADANLDTCDDEVTFDIEATMHGFIAVNVRPADESV